MWTWQCLELKDSASETEQGVEVLGWGCPWTPGSPIENCSTLWSGFTLTPGWTGRAIDPRGWEAEVCWVLGLSRCGQPNFWSILTGDPSFLHVYSVFSLLWVPGSFLSLLSCLVAGKSVNMAWKEGKEENLDAFRLASFQGKQSEVTNVFDFFFFLNICISWALFTTFTLSIGELEGRALKMGQILGVWGGCWAEKLQRADRVPLTAAGHFWCWSPFCFHRSA